jgi:hypothetical protein
MEGFFKQEKLKAKLEAALDAKAKAEQYLARKGMDGGGGGEDDMPPPPWEAFPPPVGVQAMVGIDTDLAFKPCTRHPTTSGLRFRV